MIVKNILFASVFSVIGFASCTDQSKHDTGTTKNSTSINKSHNMNSFISIFEIPATNISRAVNFYQAILGLKIESMDIPGMQMGIFPYEGQTVSGVIIKAEGYKPSANGITIYLNGGNDLQIILDKVESNGGKILIPKTPHADDNGYFAIFHDSEGNKMGLHSTN